MAKVEMTIRHVSIFFLRKLLLVAVVCTLLPGNNYGEHVAETKSPKIEQKASKPNPDSVIAQLESNMVRVEGGSFKMGCTPEQGNDCDILETPVHEVTLSSFHIGKYEVTQEEWEAVMGSNPSHFKGCPKCPVEQVSWNDIQEFLQKLNTKTGNNYRLLTEAEWEYAARGGKRSKGYKYSGANNNLSSVGWYKRNSDDKTQEVGTKRPNELGLFDMSGNVYEWCSDWYDTGYYARSPRINPTGPATGKSKVFRGGAWYFIDWIYGGSKRNSYDSSERRKYGVSIHRVSYRNGYVPSFRFYFIGFRLCRT